MGYGNYAPGANSRMASELTPLQQALRSLPLEESSETLALIDKLTRNVQRAPGEEKIRKLNLANEKIKKAIVDVPNALDLMKTMGWVQDGDSLALPSTVRFAHEVHVVGIIEAQDYYKDELKKERVRQERARKEVDADTEKLRDQIEADRKEKAAEGPVTKGSVAQKRGSGQMMRASDLGIGQNAGG
jgi:hypothetical protein